MMSRSISVPFVRGRTAAWLLAALLLPSTHTWAQPAIFSVNSAADATDAAIGDGFCETAPGNGVCSLRAAIQEANATADADVINLAAGTYTLTILGRGEDDAAAGDLDITRDLTIVGADPATTIVQSCAPVPPASMCDGIDRVLHVDPFGSVIHVTIANVTIQRGMTVGIPFVSNMGGGVLLGVANTLGDPVPVGTLTLTNSIVRSNRATHCCGASRGGGLANKGGTLTLVRTTVTENAADTSGGGIVQEWLGSLTLNASTVSANTSGSGGGIFSFGADVVLRGSTVSGNVAGAGGGLYNYRANVLVADSTFSGNQASGAHGGLANEQGALTLKGSTITNNQAGGGGGGGGVQGSATVANTIIAGNRVGSTQIDCDGTLTSVGYNIIQTTSFPFSSPSCIVIGDTTGNIMGQAALLAPLANNGGPTHTHALLSGSPAIGAGNPAVPGSTSAACTVSDQRAIARPEPVGGRCDIGAFELQGLAVTRILPDHAGDAAPLVAMIQGNGFSPGASVKLTRVGEGDIVGSPTAVGERNVTIATAFDVAGRARGAWDLVVTNPGGNSVTEPGALTLEEARAGDLWMDIIGHELIRVGRPARFTILFGNRGNTDALAVPMVLGIRKEVALKFLFDIATPPPQPGDPPVNWGSISRRATSSQLANMKIVPFIIPVVPAGFTGIMSFTVTAPPATHGQTLQLAAGIGSPYLQPTLAPQVVQKLTAGAESYARRVCGIDLAPEALQAIAPYLDRQLNDVVALGRHNLVKGHGVQPVVYSAAQLLVAVVQAVSGLSCDSPGGDDDGDGEQDDEDDDSDDDEDDDDDDDEEDDDESDCEEAGFNTCAPPPCNKWPPTACGGVARPGTIGGAIDPNDKVASLGVGDEHYITGDGDLRYAILFENLETATLPAQEVVVTDQLDVSTLDLDSFSVGSISFGTHTVVPPPGLSAFTADVDLPERNLVARVEARLDKTTGIVTWRFTSLDPQTMEVTEEPAAGFLPPNVNPPEGDGALAFTVRPKADLLSDTQICNQARIVFDVNPPIDTPSRCNTIDRTKPTSQVAPLPPVQPSSTFVIQWTGSDSGSGILTYDILVSENNGPFVPWAERIEAPSVLFTGTNGSTYAFVSVARDRTGNVEDLPTVPDATTRIAVAPDLVEVSVSEPPSALVLNERFQITDTVENEGGSSSSSRTRYYLSANQTRDSGDIRLGGSRLVPALAAGQTSTGSVRGTVTRTAKVGTYFVLACADDLKAVAESDELNNCTASTGTVEVKAPDLVESAVSNPPTSAAKGSTFSVTDTTTNRGNAPAGASTTRYFLSLDIKKSASDVAAIGERAVPLISAGQSFPGTVVIGVPATIASGNFYVLACADAANKIAEGNITRTGEKNNCLASASRVTIP